MQAMIHDNRTKKYTTSSSFSSSWRYSIIAILVVTFVVVHVAVPTTTTIVLVSSFQTPTLTNSRTWCRNIPIRRQKRDSAALVPTTATTTLQLSSSTTTSTTEEQQAEGSASLVLDGRKINGPLVPLNNFLLVKIAAAIEATTGGILLTGKAKQVKTEGTVMAIGPGKTHPDSGITIPMPVSVGMNVVYGKYDGTEIDYNGSKHTLIRDDDILITFTSDLPLNSLETVEVVRDNILVFVEQKEIATEGGILIAKSSKGESKPSIGQVIKVGPGKMAANGQIMVPSVQVGDYIKFRDYAGNEVDIDGKEYTVVKMTDVLAKF